MRKCMLIAKAMTADNRGSVLIGVIGLAIVMAIAALGYLQLSATTANGEITELHESRAFWAAEGGMLLGAQWLNDSGNVVSVSDLWAGESMDDILPDFALNGYDVDVDIIRTAGGATIRSTVPSHAVLGYDKVVSQNVALCGSDQTFPFAVAAFAKTSIAFTGNGHTDSYNSDSGAYGGSNVDSKGSISTNGTASGAITLHGNAAINGDAGTGPNGTVSLSGNAQVNGDITHNTAIDMPPVSVPSSVSDLTSSGNYTLNANNKAKISSGSYKYSSFSVSGNGIDTISGDVILYVTGDFSTSGNGKVVITPGSKLTLYVDGTTNLSGNGVVNNAASPSSFLIQSTFSGANGVSISGNAVLKGAIYAPNSDVVISGNGENYGAIVSGNFTDAGNGGFHYDTALKNTGVSIEWTATSSLVVGSWQETNDVTP